MGAKVQFKIASRTDGSFTSPEVEYSTETASLFKPSYSTGQIIFVEDELNIYLDFHNWRKCYTKGGGSSDPDVVRYIGQTETDPNEQMSQKGTVLIVGSGEVTPRLNDIVALAHTKKEFLYRVDVDENGQPVPNGLPKWFEIGDEGAPEWND